MENLVNSLQLIIQVLISNLLFVTTILIILWSIQLMNWASRYRLNILGIYPRHPIGLIGIFTSPFLHGSFTHLFFNSIPLFMLISFLLVYGQTTFYITTLCIMMIGGILIWLFGRKALHVGASSVIMGYFGFLLINAYHNFNVLSVLLVIFCLYYFSSLLLGLFPTDEKTSWEGHVFGFVAGIATNYLLPYLHVGTGG